MSQPQNISRVDHLLFVLRDFQVFYGGNGLTDVANYMRIIGAEDQPQGTYKGVSTHEGGLEKAYCIVVDHFQVILRGS